ncbi:MAG TPA: H-X9-DG-CTERM domain-containing protein [Armatimonadota bacterium]
MAVSITDCRHNNGTNVAFLDGHAQWVQKSDVTPLLYIPSVLGAFKTSYVGPMFTTPVNWTDLPGKLAAYNMTVIMGMGQTGNNGDAAKTAFATTGSSSVLYAARNTTTMAITDDATAQLPWLRTGTAGTVSTVDWGNSYVCTAAAWFYGWGAIPNYSLFPILAADGTTTVRNDTITIMPNVTEPTAKRMAVVLLQKQDGQLTGTITSIKIGAQTVPDIQNKSMKTANGMGPKAMAAMVLLCLKKDTPIEIKLSTAGLGAGHPSLMYLVFEK